MSDKVLLPARYDAMCRAIDAAYEVDEVKEIRDQARALEVYAQQAINTDAERRAHEIRLRAERRVGELLRDREMAKGAPGPGRGKAGQTAGPAFTEMPTLRDLGISKQQSSDWQRLARIPAEQFERALADKDNPPSTAGLTKKPMPVSDNALWFWGRLLEIERRQLLDHDIDDLLLTMSPHMLQDIYRLAPILVRWLDTLGEKDV